nr:MAG TPA: hypothetical protein [Caudoviricetes sp.]
MKWLAIQLYSDGGDAIAKPLFSRQYSLCAVRGFSACQLLTGTIFFITLLTNRTEGGYNISKDRS